MLECFHLSLPVSLFLSLSLSLSLFIVRNFHLANALVIIGKQKVPLPLSPSHPHTEKIVKAKIINETRHLGKQLPR